MCCGWVGGGALDCPALKVAPGVKDIFFEEALANKFF